MTDTGTDTGAGAGTGTGAGTDHDTAGTNDLVIKDLVVDYAGTPPVRALDGVTLTAAAGTTLGLVGESGSGKSTLAAAIARLLPTSARTEGSLTVGGVDLLELKPDRLRRFRRDRLAVVAQDPIGSLDPTLRVGRQLSLVLRGLGQDPSNRRVCELLESMAIGDPERVLRLFPHELSGGMAQRVVLALALCRRPRLLIADEPTASLDSQVRGEVITLLIDRVRALGTTLLWLSHDLGAVTRWCAEVAVMYAGRVVEHGPAAAVLAAPTHPYTRALVATDPRRTAPGSRLITIGGSPPILHGRASGCAFAPRCRDRIEACDHDRPGPVGPRATLCLRAEPASPELQQVSS